jgi:hypothetical protein
LTYIALLLAFIFTTGFTFTGRLYWEDNSTDEAGFVIERRIQGQGGWEVLAVVDANITEYAIYVPDSRIKNCFRIRAYNLVGRAPPSNQRCVIVNEAQS